MNRKEREIVRVRFGGRCAYCGCVLAEKWHVDHLKPVARDTRYCDNKRRYVTTGKLWHPENNCLENCMPACMSCNIDKGMNELEQWRSWLQERMVDALRRDVPNFRHAERFGLITVHPVAPIIFWFEKYEQAA